MLLNNDCAARDCTGKVGTAGSQYVPIQPLHSHIEKRPNHRRMAIGLCVRRGEKMSGNYIQDQTAKDLQRKEELQLEEKEERIREFKKERGVMWISKAAAAKRAGISRVTLDSWISTNVLPDAAVMIEGPRKVKIDADELDRVASARSTKRMKAATGLKHIETIALEATQKVLEAENYQLGKRVEELTSSLNRIEDLRDKQIEEANAAFEREREMAAKVETELRSQLAKAEARAEAAEREAKKGVLRKMFS